MNRAVSLLCAGTLASATVLTPISATPVRADEDVAARAYFSIKLGSGEVVKDRTRYGFQLNRSWDRGDEDINPFATPRELTVLDFAVSGEGGLAKADVMGLDTITAYEVWSGKERFGLFGGMPREQQYLLLLAGGAVLVSCLAWWCDDDDDDKEEKPSDMRLKRDVAYLTTLENGIKLYAFRYLWDETVRVGVMAQDLLSDETRRRAVKMMPSGFYAVDYARLGLKMATLEAWREQGRSAISLRSAITEAGNISAVRAHEAPGLITSN